MTFLLQFRKATQQKKTKTKLETCARDCAELQARRVQATHGNRGWKRAAPISQRPEVLYGAVGLSIAPSYRQTTASHGTEGADANMRSMFTAHCTKS